MIRKKALEVMAAEQEVSTMVMKILQQQREVAEQDVSRARYVFLRFPKF